MDNYKLDPFIFRYKIYNIGSKNEHAVIARTNCCVESMTLRVTDVAGNFVVSQAVCFYDQIPQTTIYAIIGGSCGALLVLTIIVIAVFIRKAYDPVPRESE